MDIKTSMELAGTNLLNCLLPHNDLLPLWSIEIDHATSRAWCNTSCPEHNIGRWWDALLRLESATGFEIPNEMEAAMVRHLKSLLDNPLSICWSPQQEDDFFDLHSQREVLLALAGLMRYRENEWALPLGTQMIRALDRYINTDGSWNIQEMIDLAQEGGRPLGEKCIADTRKFEAEAVRLTYTHGRMIEALLEFHTASGSEDALMLADRLARYHFEGSTLPDGSVPDTEGYIHTHSLFGTYRGLLMYGQLTRQHKYIERIATTYAVTVRTRVKQSGFISHDWGSDTNGETTSPGDAAQLALRLAKLGYTEFLDDAERIVRARIIPTQITAPIGLQPMDKEKELSAAELDTLSIGSYGGVHMHPYGAGKPVTDITAADLHTLCDIYTHIVEETDMGLVVNFHFDYEDDRIRIETVREEAGRLIIQTKQAEPVAIRIPAWVPPESVELTVNGQPGSASRIGQLLFFPQHKEPVMIQVEYELPVKLIAETTDSVTYNLTWRGDDVIGIAPNTDLFPFYPTASE